MCLTALGSLQGKGTGRLSHKLRIQKFPYRNVEQRHPFGQRDAVDISTMMPSDAGRGMVTQAGPWLAPISQRHRHEVHREIGGCFNQKDLEPRESDGNDEDEKIVDSSSKLLVNGLNRQSGSTDHKNGHAAQRESAWLVWS